MKKQTSRWIVAVAGSALALGAAASGANAGTTANQTDRLFARTVSHGNIAEVQTGRLALKKSSNPKVRWIAGMMVKQHGQAQQDLKKVSRQTGIAIPSAPDPMQRAEYRRLSRLSGSAFDKAYMKGLVHDHFATVALFQKEMASGDQTLVHSYAQQYLPAIQTHAQDVANVASNMGIVVASASGVVTGTNGKPGHPGKMGRSSSASMPPADNH